MGLRPAIAAQAVGPGKPERMDARMRWIGWLAKWAAGALLASALSVLTTFYMVESYMEALLARWNLSVPEAPVLDLERLFSLGETANKGEAEGEVSEPNPNLRETGRDRPIGGALKVTAPVVSGEAGGSPGSGTAAGEGNLPDETPEPVSGAGEPFDQDAVPVFGSALSGALVMSAEEFNEKRKNLSESDKAEIFTILLNRVPQEELQMLSLLLEDGITADEANTMMEVIGGYLEREEVNRLLAILGSE